jgi:hypothetical protein
MEPDRTTRPSVVGYLVVLVGVAGWVVSCFLPLYEIADLEARISLYSQITSFGTFGSKLGGLLYLFGGIAAIGVISIFGVLGVRRWISILLAGAVVAWVLTSSGVLISIGGSFGEVSTSGSSLAMGYWGLWASVVCVIVGTVKALSEKREDAATGGLAPPEQVG